MEGGSYGVVLRIYWINKVTLRQNTTHTGTVSLLLSTISTTILCGSWSQVTRSISDLTYKLRPFLHSRWELFLCDTGRNAFPEGTKRACRSWESVSRKPLPQHALPFTPASIFFPWQLVQDKDVLASQLEPLLASFLELGLGRFWWEPWCTSSFPGEWQVWQSHQ